MTFLRYRVSDADRMPLPANYAKTPRVIGFTCDDTVGPYAHFMRPRTKAIQPSPREALLRGPSPTALAYPVSEFATRLQSGRDDVIESGWARRKNQVFVACETDMPDVTPRMWDWWFGWHGSHSVRYKLWNPDAHLYAGWGDERTLSTPGRERYLNNVSYVDEYIGTRMQRLAIRFIEPEQLGFRDNSETMTICARVGFAGNPLLFGWLVHHVHPTSTGSRMRSRFLLGDVEVVPELSQSLSRLNQRFSVPASVSHFALPRGLGHDMLYHCAAEMNHLAQILPGLYETFSSEHV